MVGRGRRMTVFSHRDARRAVWESPLPSTEKVVLGAILDHYGLLDAPVHELSLSRVAGIAIFFLGVWLTMK